MYSISCTFAMYWSKSQNFDMRVFVTLFFESSMYIYCSLSRWVHKCQVFWMVGVSVSCVDNFYYKLFVLVVTLTLLFPHNFVTCCICLLTYSMVQSPSWEANWSAASQEIPRISWNPKVHYRTHKHPPPVSIWASPIQSLYTYPTSWRSILILSAHLRLGLPSGLLPSGFPTKTLYVPLSSPIRATCPAHLILLDFITSTILGEEYKSFSSS